MFALLNDEDFKNISKYLILGAENPSLAHSYATDFGGVTVAFPEGIFRPETISQLQCFIRLAQKHKIKINIRGQGHSMHGHALIDKGIIIDLKSIMGKIKFSPLYNNAVEVPACFTWHDIVKFSLNYNLTVPVLTDYLDLSVGGTLSYGGLGGCSFRYGSQADHVLSLDVLTYQGEIIACSKNENSHLFNAVLCGLGQFGIILKATIPLVQAKKYVECYRFYYKDLSDFCRDQIYLSQSLDIDYLKGSIKKQSKSIDYIIKVACFYNDQTELKNKSIIKLLKSKIIEKENILYSDFIRQTTDFIHMLSEQNLLNVPHPCYNVLIPENEIIAHTELALNNPYLTGEEPVIIYPIHSKSLKQSFFRKPKGDVVFILGLLYNCGLNATQHFPYLEVIKFNQNLFQDAQKRGGYCYPVGNVQSDLKQHFNDLWPLFKNMKEHFDPFEIYDSQWMAIEERQPRY